MEGGISLQRILDKKMHTEARKALIELPKLQKRLKHFSIAHCDIKPANIVYKDGRYLLIDNDEVVKFG